MQRTSAKPARGVIVMFGPTERRTPAPEWACGLLLHLPRCGEAQVLAFSFSGGRSGNGVVERALSQAFKPSV